MTLDRRSWIIGGLGARDPSSHGAGGRRPAAPASPAPQPAPAGGPATTYQQSEIVNQVSDFFGVTAESAGAAVEKSLPRRRTATTGYIAGEEGSGAIVMGLATARACSI